MVIEKLISIASTPIAAQLSQAEITLAANAYRSGFIGLAKLLSIKNGFYAFERALHMRPWLSTAEENQFYGIQAWNESSCWKIWYDGLLDDMLFFGEDVFGGQFALRDSEVISFEPETGGGFVTCSIN